MHVLVLGGSGRTGRLIATRLLAQGHRVTLAGRRDPVLPGAAFRPTDLSDPAALRALAEGVEAVASALASGPANPVCSGVARALAGQAGLRFVSVAGAAVDAPGDAKGVSDRAIGWIMRRVAGPMLADRQTELGVLQDSRLRWTMLRPPRLTDAAGTGRWRLTQDRPASSAIARADLAAAVCAVLPDAALAGRAPFVAG